MARIKLQERGLPIAPLSPHSCVPFTIVSLYTPIISTSSALSSYPSPAPGFHVAISWAFFPYFSFEFFLNPRLSNYLRSEAVGGGHLAVHYMHVNLPESFLLLVFVRWVLLLC